MNRNDKSKTKKTQKEKMMPDTISRRNFIQSATAAGLAASMTASLRGQEKAVSAAEKINIGVGLIGDDKEHYDSGKTIVDGIVLTDQWQRYSIPLNKLDLSSIKTGFVITLSGRSTPVTVYLDNVRYIR